MESARPPGDFMHGAFEWDNQDAADHWRDHQAGEIIRSVVCVYEEANDDAKPNEPSTEVYVRAFLPETPRGPSRGYKPVDEILASPEMRQAHLAQFWIDLKAFRRRYEHLQKACEILDTLADEMLDDAS